jgi:hypothetical protein
VCISERHSRLQNDYVRQDIYSHLRICFKASTMALLKRKSTSKALPIAQRISYLSPRWPAKGSPPRRCRRSVRCRESSYGHYQGVFERSLTDPKIEDSTKPSGVYKMRTLSTTVSSMPRRRLFLTSAKAVHRREPNLPGFDRF